MKNNTNPKLKPCSLLKLYKTTLFKKEVPYNRIELAKKCRPVHHQISVRNKIYQNKI